MKYVTSYYWSMMTLTTVGCDFHCFFFTVLPPPLAAFQPSFTAFHTPTAA